MKKDWVSCRQTTLFSRTQNTRSGRVSLKIWSQAERLCWRDFMTCTGTILKKVDPVSSQWKGIALTESLITTFCPASQRKSGSSQSSITDHYSSPKNLLKTDSIKSPSIKTGDGKQTWWMTGSPSTKIPGNPFGAWISSILGRLSCWNSGQKNVAVIKQSNNVHPFPSFNASLTPTGSILISPVTI